VTTAAPILIARRWRSRRSAAIAGIIFAVLLLAGLTMIRIALSESSLQVLRGFLAREKDLGIRRELVHAIAQHRPEDRVVPLLEEIIASDQPVPIRSAATEGLGRHRSKRSLEIRLFASSSTSNTMGCVIESLKNAGLCKRRFAASSVVQSAADSGFENR